MAGTVNRMTDDFLQERTQAPLEKIKDWASPFVSALQDRIGVVKAGKRMLDDGGEAAELEMLAKKVSLDAVALDNDITDRIQQAVDLYTEAASLIRSQNSGLAAAYDVRSKIFSKCLDNLCDPPENPPMTDVEWDAVKLIKLRQAKAQLGLCPHVGGPRAGRHGSASFFSTGFFSSGCVEKDHQPQTTSGVGRGALHGALVDHGMAQDYPVAAVASSTPSVLECSAPEVGHPAQNSLPPRENTIDTLNNCMESLDTLKTVIDTIDVPAPSPTHSTTSIAMSAPAQAPSQSPYGPYPGLDASIVSYAVGAKDQPTAEAASASTSAGGCPYKVGDPVEIYSKSADTWVSGSIIRVEGWVVTVRYGDRERKVDLTAAGVSSFFRTASLRSANVAPAFDSMLTNPSATSAISVEPRATKHAVL